MFRAFLSSQRVNSTEVESVELCSSHKCVQTLDGKAVEYDRQGPRLHVKLTLPSLGLFISNKQGASAHELIAAAKFLSVVWQCEDDGEVVGVSEISKTRPILT